MIAALYVETNGGFDATLAAVRADRTANTQGC